MFDLSRIGRLAYHDGILILPVKKEQIGKNLLEIYEMKETMTWRKRPVKYAIVASFSCDGKMEKARMYKEFIYYLTRDSHTIQRILNGETVQDVTNDLVII